MAKFTVLPKVNSFRLRRQRYFPGDVVEVTDEEAARLNLDFLAPATPEPIQVQEDAVLPQEVEEASPSSETSPVEQKVKRKNKAP